MILMLPWKILRSICSMNIILDTNAFLWLIGNQAKLSRKAATTIADKQNTFFLSVASPWEMAIKSQSGKLVLPEPIEPLISRETALNNIEVLPVSLDAISLVETLPSIHRDPFDRIIIATALTQNFAVMSSDAVFDDYNVSRIW
ncbi:MAG: type II toxin-antitoxin system VapC family toxin [Candidatus Kapaibacterium sp.]|nr:MAG: type II toxin-antitoxin system VapC family toxin [Candidatus Kapabacteria bacterium]